MNSSNNTSNNSSIVNNTSMTTNKKGKIKIVLVGASEVGKTSIA